MLFKSMGWDYVSELRPPAGLLFIPQMTWAQRTMAEYRQRELLIRPPELSDNTISSHLVAKQEELAKEMMNLALRSISLILRRFL
jgi:hypothetical protein